MIHENTVAPLRPLARINLAITGHREGNAAFAANRGHVEQVLGEVLDIISSVRVTRAASIELAPTRLHSMLSEGVDLMAAEHALSRGWELVAPLAFGLDLNVAINALPTTAADALTIIAGGDPADPLVKHRADSVRSMAARARLFELTDRDQQMAELLVAGLQEPIDRRKADTFAAECSLRVELAAHVMLAHADLLIAVWDGVTRAFIGGTGQTVQLALEIGAPVVWINATAPDSWRIFMTPEALANVHAAPAIDTDRTAALQALVRAALSATPARNTHGGRNAHRAQVDGQDAFARERWRATSSRWLHGYRRVEALFGADTWRGRLRNLRQVYETPNAVANGSAAKTLAHIRTLRGQDLAFIDAVEGSTVRRFAWADGISAYLSDAYRGGMTLNFLLAPMAIVVGIAYLPFATSNEKWLFAAFELALLASILVITITGQRRRWHARWFETRRVAEYLRHAPILLSLGVVRAPCSMNTWCSSVTITCTRRSVSRRRIAI